MIMMMMMMMVMVMMVMVIHLDLLKDYGEPAGHALVSSKSRSHYHALHTGQPHLGFGMVCMVFGGVYFVFRCEVFGTRSLGALRAPEF